MAEVEGSIPSSSTGVWPASVESSGRQLTWSLPAGGRSWPSGDVVKPGVHAWLSARRPRVRISSSPLWKWTRKDGSCLESSQGRKAQQVRFLSLPLVRVRCQRQHATLPTSRTGFNSPYPQSEHRPNVVRALHRPKPSGVQMEGDP